MNEYKAISRKAAFPATSCMIWFKGSYILSFMSCVNKTTFDSFYFISVFEMKHIVAHRKCVICSNTRRLRINIKRKNKIIFTLFCS